MSRAVLSLAATLLAGLAQAATLETYVEAGSGNAQRALGYPVPLPVESQTPVAGYRSYASLHARHQALALQSADIEAHEVGRTLGNRPIWAYVLSDADGVRSDGEAEPAFMVNGGIHAREWQSPEVVTAFIEGLAAGAGGRGIERYLLDEARIVIVPVLNVDGFLQTQRYPTQVLRGDDPRESEWPRDGRMRRKNMRGADENLSTQGDHLRGIDLNRNFPPFFGAGSGNPNDLTYRGPNAGSEPESQALLAAARLAPESALRSYVDAHSFTRVLFVQNTGVPGRDEAANSLAHLFIYAEAGFGGLQRPFYANSPEPVNRGLGGTADHFGYTWQIPSWTLELEPGEDGSVEYGGAGDSHDGFILPASQIARVRHSVWQAQRLLFYRMSGAPWLREVRVLDAVSGEVVHDAGWEANASARTLRVRRALPLRPGQRYRLWLGFSKPMRLRADGAIAQIPGVPELEIPLAPTVELGAGAGALALTGGEWLDRAGPPGHGYLRWQDDAFVAEFTLPPQASGELGLLVRAQDLSGEYLDSEPASPVRWSAGWSGVELGGDAADRQHRFVVAGGDPALRLAQRPRQLAEGDVLRLQLVRADASAPASVRVRSEALDTDGADFAPLDLRLDLAAGQASAGFQLRALEDLRAEADKRLRLHFEAADTGTRLGDFVLDLLLVDNDSTSGGRWVLAGDALATTLPLALAAANSAGRPVAIETAAGALATLADSGGDTALPAIAGDISLDGHGLQLVVPAARRAFDVAAGGRLQLRDLRLTAAAGTALAGDGGLLRNAGRLELRELDLSGGGARRGGQVHSSGEALLDRVRLVGGSASEGGAQVHASGALQILRSASLQAGSGAAALWTEGDALLRAVSVAESGATVALRRAAGSLRIGRSLLAGARNCAAGAGLVDDGDNLDSDGSCGLGGAAGTGLVVLADVGGLPSPQPAGAAIDAAAACEGQDLHGRARPQGLRCDAGAIESGISPRPGLWYDPARDGSGFAIELVGRLLFVIWYTYDEGGLPVAYTAQADLAGARWSAPLLRFRRNAAGAVASTAVGTLSLDFSGSERAGAAFDFGAGASGTLALQYLQFASGRGALDVRGTWASPEFAFQGFSLVDQGEVLAALSYFYDAGGTLRWVLGTGAARRGASLDVLRFSGTCPACAYRPPVAESAGTLDFRFDGRDRGRVRASAVAADRGQWSADTPIEAFR